MKNIDRRNFIKKTSLSAAAVSIMPNYLKAGADRPLKSQYMGGFAAPKLEKVRAAFIGVGARGGGHVRFFADLPNTEVVAICDLYEDLVKQKTGWVKEVSKPGRHKNIKQYWGDENKWKVMLDEVKPDVVFIATNWKNHAPMAIESMSKGAHAFVEVPIAVTLEEMWDIVDASERTQKHCMMLENVNYNRDELMFLNMCRQGMPSGKFYTVKRLTSMNCASKWKNSKEVPVLGEHPIMPIETEIYIQPMVWDQ